MGWYVVFLILASASTVATAPFGFSVGVALLIGTAAAAGLLAPFFIRRRRKDAWLLTARQAAPAFALAFGGAATASRVARGGPLAVVATPGGEAAVAQQEAADAARCERASRMRVIVCAFEPKFGALVEADAEHYRTFWPTTTRVTSTPAAFLEALGNGADIVHLLGEVGGDQKIVGLGRSGEQLIANCAAAGVQLLWIASDNPPQVYIDGFHTKGRPMNLIMTLQRHGSILGSFLEKLLTRTRAGEAIGLTWVRLCPQGVPGPSAPDAPATIFAMGAPDWPGPVTGASRPSVGEQSRIR